MALIENVVNLSDETLTEWMNNGHTISSIVRKLGFNGQDARARSLLKQRIESLGLVRSVVRSVPTWTDEALLAAIPNNNSWSSVALSLGLSTHGTNIQRLRQRARELQADTTSIVGVQGGRKMKYTDPDTVLCVNTLSRTVVKNFILRNGILKYQCVGCNNEGRWNGDKLVLQLDHIDGNPHNNQLNNLRFLCPNCHSQTPTYVAKNKGR